MFVFSIVLDLGGAGAIVGLLLGSIGSLIHHKSKHGWTVTWGGTTSENVEQEEVQRYITVHDGNTNDFKVLSENDFSFDVDYTYEEKRKGYVQEVRYLVDISKRLIFCPNGSKYGLEQVEFSHITDVEILQNGQTSGNIGNAIIGGVLAGGVGALAGSNISEDRIISLSVIIYTTDIVRPQIIIELITKPTFKDFVEYNKAYDFAQKVNASIKAIIANEK